MYSDLHIAIAARITTALEKLQVSDSTFACVSDSHHVYQTESEQLHAKYPSLAPVASKVLVEDITDQKK